MVIEHERIRSVVVADRDSIMVEFAAWIKAPGGVAHRYPVFATGNRQRAAPGGYQR